MSRFWGEAAARETNGFVEQRPGGGARVRLGARAAGYDLEGVPAAAAWVIDTCLRVEAVGEPAEWDSACTAAMVGLLRLCLRGALDWEAHLPRALYALDAPAELCEALFLETVDVRWYWEPPEMEARLSLAAALWPHCEFWRGKICRYPEGTLLGGGRRHGVRARLNVEGLHLVAALAAEAALEGRNARGYVGLLEGLLALGADPVFAAACAVALAPEGALPAALRAALAARLRPGELEGLAEARPALIEGLGARHRA